MKQNNVKVVGSKATANMVASAAANHNAIQVMVFENPEFGRIRTMTDKKGYPLFCGKDVCEALGYRKPDVAVRQHVTARDVTKRYVGLMVGQKKDGTPIVQQRQILFVTESGLYDLIFGSKLDSAQKFKHWVTSVVLPQIRKTGGFVPLNESDTDEDIRRRTEEVLKATLEQKDKLISEQEVLLEQKNKQLAEQDVEIDRLLPKALYADSVLESISCYTTTQIAKELGMTAQELNRWLCAERIQYYQSGQYMLYAEYAHRGLAKSRTHYELFVGRDTVHTRMYLVWTETGREFIHQKVKG